ncbi:MAG: hypothetical protein ACLQIB_02005 [Isosphaeraceae bacterium]
MGLYYQAEYRIGRRGGRVCHSYSGVRAFLAILFDLVFGLLFDVLAAVFAVVTRSLIRCVRFTAESLKVCWRMLVFAMTALVDALPLPHGVMHADLGAVLRDMVPIHVLALPRRVMQDTFDWLSWHGWRDSIATRRGRVVKPDHGVGREV